MIYGFLIETSSENLSVGISSSGTLEYILEESCGYKHAEKIHGFIDRCLKEKGLNISDLHYIGLGTGPGSYTGLRIGFSVAKAMAYALQIPLVGTDSNRSVFNLVYRPTANYDKYFIMADAGRMEVYLSEYGPNGDTLCSPKPFILTDEFIKHLVNTPNILLAGNGIKKIIHFFNNKNDVALFPDILPSVRGLSRELYEKYKQGFFLDLFHAEPDYLKEYFFKSGMMA
ncbi:MAG: tRNA (adenosine(37)-N6)-threonylcarbamoyltransferase complex dimerization subunit type 1 TsaB [Bacteroidia bacterium]|nr:tRNA (adenosine(37)-N6)-threonylcarbamoyltransferase complex dimerization subunit type 1 TsaB [Bacteroidia bacterium]